MENKTSKVLGYVPHQEVHILAKSPQVSLNKRLYIARLLTNGSIH